MLIEIFDTLLRLATPIVLEATLQISIVFLIAAVGTRMLGRCSAAVRHRIWSLVFCSLFLMPAIGAIVPQWTFPVPVISTQAITPVVDHGETSGRLSDAPMTPEEESPATVEMATTIAPETDESGPIQRTSVEVRRQLNISQWRTPFAIVVWSIGFLAVIGQLLRSQFYKRRLLADSRIVDDENWNRQLQAVTQQLGIRRLVRLYQSQDENIPVTWGVFRPLIMLPVSAAGWSERRRRYVLTHELSHIQRCDLPFQIVAHLACAVYWFNPLLWYGYWRLCAECEQACDDSVVQQGGVATDYASELVRLARELCISQVQAAVAITRTTKLEQRVKALFDRTKSHLPLNHSSRAGSLIAVTMLVLVTATMQPRLQSVTADEPAKSNQASTAAANATDAESTTDPLPAGARGRLGTTRWRHASDICVVRFSPDGTVLATGSMSDPVRIWDFATGKQLHELSQMGRWHVYGIQFSPDGATLYTLQEGGRLRAWDVATGQQLGDQKHPVNAYERIGIAISADGKVIGTVSPADVRLWDASSLNLLKTFPMEGKKGFAAPGIAFSPDGQILAAASKSDVRLWDLKSDKLLLTIPNAHAQEVTSLVFKPDSKILVSGGIKEVEMIQIGNLGGASTAGIRLWDVASGEKLDDLKCRSFDSGLYSLAMSADGRLLVSGHHSEARVWNLDTLSLVRIVNNEYSTRGGYPCIADLSRSGEWIASRRAGHCVGVWEVATGELFENVYSHCHAISSIAEAVDQKIVTASRENSMLFWDPATSQRYHDFHFSRIDGFPSVTISPDGKTIAGGSGHRLHTGKDTLEFKGNVMIADLVSGTKLADREFSDVIGSIVFSPDGQTLAAKTDNRASMFGKQKEEGVLIIDARDGSERIRLSGAGEVVKSSFSANAKLLYTVSSDGTFREWDLETGQDVRKFAITDADKPNVHFAAISSDGRYVAASMLFGKAIFVCDIATGKPLYTIERPDTLGNTLAISSNGRILASACQQITNTDQRFDELIHLWDIQTGKELHSFDASTDGTVSTLYFLSDGKTLATGMNRGTTLLWDLSKVPSLN